MSLLIKALKKAEKDNKLAVDATLDPELDLQADEDPLSLANAQESALNTAPASKEPAEQTPAPARAVQAERTPLAFADDDNAQQLTQPSLDTPRHAPGVEPGIEKPPEPVQAPALGDTGAAQGEPVQTNNRSEPTLEPLGKSVSTANPPVDNIPVPEAPPVSESTPRAQPMAIADRSRAPRWLVGGIVAIVISSALAWSGLNYLRGQADIAGYDAGNSLEEPEGVLAGLPAQPLTASEPTASSPAGTAAQAPAGQTQSVQSPVEPVRTKPTTGSAPVAGSASGESVAPQQSKPGRLARKPSSSQTATIERQAGGQAGTVAANKVQQSPSRAQGAAGSPALPAVRFVRRDALRARKMAALNSAYELLRSGQLEPARQAYKQVLQQDSNLSDAWIGLGSIAARQGDTTSARLHYERALRINPNDAVALAGLATLSEEQDLVSRESRLRNLAARDTNEAAVQFALGNALAAQRRWAEAQQAYFLASAADPAQPDYAFNLAVSLEQVRQPAAALPHYKRALRAAQKTPARFDQAIAQSRIDAISGMLKR